MITERQTKTDKVEVLRRKRLRPLPADKAAELITLNGQLADAWSDGQLKSGGIGLFADKGEVSWVRAVQIVDKDDLIGRLALTLRRTFGGKE